MDNDPHRRVINPSAGTTTIASDVFIVAITIARSIRAGRSVLSNIKHDYLQIQTGTIGYDEGLMERS